MKLLRCWLRAGVFEGGVVSDIEAGTPQGSPISPLLANIALHVLDEAWATAGGELGTLVRYGDDFVVLCPTRERAEAGPRPGRDDSGPARAASASRQDQDRRPHPRGRGFRLLGLPPSAWWSPGSGRVAGTSSKWPSPGPWPPSEAKVRELTDRSTSGCRWRAWSIDLNPVLRGWGGYFRTETRRGSSAPSTATSTSGWPCWPAANTGFAGWNWTTASPASG